MHTDCLSAKMMKLSNEMANMAEELDEKYHLNAIELSGAAMIMADWALEVNKEEKQGQGMKSPLPTFALPELGPYDI